MNRREFLIGLSACGAGASFGAGSSSVQSCRVIGIGGAGCNLVVALRARYALDDVAPDFLCVDLGPHSLRSVGAANTDCALPPIKTLMLAPLGAGGCAQVARAACLRESASLVAAFNGVGSVILVAGLGGGSGGGITPIMACLARAMGVPTTAVVVTPFDFEGHATNRRRRRLNASAARRMPS